MPDDRKTVLLELDGISIFQIRGDRIFIEHPWVKELLEKYRVKIFSDSYRSAEYTREWGVECLRKNDLPRPFTNLLIDKHYKDFITEELDPERQSGPKQGFDSIEDFFLHQEPEHVVAKRIYLDDKRPTLPGWIRAYWPDQVIDQLESGAVTQISLDHDLGEEIQIGGRAANGNDVIEYIENRVGTENYDPPIIIVHSGNISAAPKMEQGVAKIWRIVLERRR